MKISWNHLSQLVELDNIKIEEAANKLTLAGLEVENLAYIDKIKDTILDASITANREDIKGWTQIALELSAILKRPLKTKENARHHHNIQVKNFLNTEKLKIFQELCVCHIHNASVLHKSKYFDEYANALGFSRTKSVLDIINFINLKWGQSINAYELKSGKLKEGGDFTFEAKYKMTKEKEVKIKFFINSQELRRIKVSNNRNNLIDCDVILINYSNKEKSNNSCSAREFRNNLFNAYSEILCLTKQTVDKNNVKNHTIYYHYQNNEVQRHISCKLQNVNKILGPVSTTKDGKQFLDLNTITDIAKDLNLDTEYTDRKLRIKIPPERRKDLCNEADIAEEVARIYGFNYFYDILPKFKHAKSLSNKSNIKKKIRRIFRSMGLHEVINCSMKRKKVHEDNLKIINPLNQEQEVLRTNLVGGILANKRYNDNQSNSNLEAFEIGNVFSKRAYDLEHKESLHVCCLLNNNTFNRSTWQACKSPLTWLQAKGHAEEFFEKISASISWSISANNNSFTECIKQHTHSSNSIYVTSCNQAIGILSEANYLNKKIDGSTYFLEINLDKLLKTINLAKHLQYIYNQYSNYPKITRDFSVTVNYKVSVEEIKNVIKEAESKASKIIESVTMVNEYWNNQHQKTICMRIIYRSNHKTLTNKDIEILDNMLKSKLMF